jgi:hypothetical protein
MNNIHSLEIKLLIHRLDSVRKEMEFKNEKLDFVNNLFFKEIQINDDIILNEYIVEDEIEKENNIPINEEQITEEVNSGNTNEITIESINEKNIVDLPADIKKFFRKITVLTHPDKLKEEDPLKTEKLKFYIEVTKAADKYDIATILLIGYKLGLEIDVVENYTEYINREINKLSLQLKTVEYTNSWIWYHTSNINLRKIMIERIRNQIVASRKPKNNEK